MNLIEELNRKNIISNFAENLQIGDRCLANIRHKTDGSKNILNANVIVIENQKLVRHIIVSFKSSKFLIPYNDLSELI